MYIGDPSGRAYPSRCCIGQAASDKWYTLACMGQGMNVASILGDPRFDDAYRQGSFLSRER